MDARTITKQDMWDLRLASLNEKSLFNQEDLDRINEKGQKRDSDSVTKIALENFLRDKKEKNFQSFRGGPPGFRGRGFSGTSGRGSAPTRAGRGRGFRGRGGRGGRQNPFKPDQSSFTPQPQGSGGK